jgi:hypothetical protein
MLQACIRNLLKSVLRYTFLICVTPHPDTVHVAYVNKDVGICGYFSKPKGVREQKCVGNTDLGHYD